MNFTFKHTLLIFTVILMFSCGTDNEVTTDLSIIDSIQSTSENNIANTVIFEENIDYVKGRSLIFSRQDEEEYNSFIKRMGISSKWEFDIIYKNFKKIAKNAEVPLENAKIDYLHTTEKIFGLIAYDNDTMYFNRNDEDYFVGQIFFDGKDLLIINEGLYSSSSCLEKIKLLPLT